MSAPPPQNIRMWTYLFRRTLQSIPVIIGVALISFLLSEVSGNPVRAMLAQSASPELIQKQKEFYGFDKPRHERFASYMGRLTKGDLGASITNHGLPVREMITN